MEKRGAKRGHAPGKKGSKRGQKGAKRAKMQIGGEKGAKRGHAPGRKGAKKVTKGGRERGENGEKRGVGRLVSRPAFIYQVAGFTHLHARLHLM